MVVLLENLQYALYTCKSHLILSRTLGGRYHYHPYFTEEKMKMQRYLVT